MAPTLTGRELARRAGDGRVVVRPEPLRCRLRLRGLATADSHTVDVTFSFSAQALDEKVERQMLAETLLADRDTATVDDVAAHFSAPLREALTRPVAQHPAEALTSGAQDAELIEALRAAAKPVAFSSGLEVLPPFDVAIESPTLQREKVEEMQRKLAERRAAGQAEHVHKAAELLKQFESLRQTMPGLSPGQLLDRVNPADRGSMLETLLLAAGAHAEQTLWAVAGPNLVRIDGRATPPRLELLPLPSDLGPLRSVQAAKVDGEHRLLVGAQGGVMVVDPKRPGEAKRYLDPGIRSPLGFNSVVATDDTIWATHGEAGVVAWRLDESGKPEFTLRTLAPPPLPANGNGVGSFGAGNTSSMSIRTGAAAEGPRNAAALDEQRILYSVGGSVFVMDRTGTASLLGTPGSLVVFIATEGEAISVVRAGGLVERLDRDTLQLIGGEQRCGGVTAAGVLPWLGTTRLLLATDDGPVCCVGTDDTLVTHYASPHRGLRAVAAAADLVAGVSADRQRIVLWKSWDGRQPAGELHVASLARHRVADICFA